MGERLHVSKDRGLGRIWSRYAGTRDARQLLSRYWPPVFLVAIALLTRLPLLSTSLDEVDSANFVNALTNGYDIPQLRPHPPGYPLYMLSGWLTNLVFNDPLRSLSLLSAVFGSLTVVPFYLLLRHLAGFRLAVIGSLFLIFNPLFWSVGEAALSDAPTVFVVTLFALLVYKARKSDGAFLGACVLASIAIGFRQPTMALLPLLLLPLAERWRRNERPWR